ncbi:hypothetical protein B8W90_14105, partial [Staphylococcus hominis]
WRCVQPGSHRRGAGDGRRPGHRGGRGHAAERARPRRQPGGRDRAAQWLFDDAQCPAPTGYAGPAGSADCTP